MNETMANTEIGVDYITTCNYPNCNDHIKSILNLTVWIPNSFISL